MGAALVVSAGGGSRVHASGLGPNETPDGYFILERDRPLPGNRSLSHYQLANGLEVFILPQAAAPVVTFQIWYRVGSKHEKLDPRLRATGLAHLFEHMMFRGTEKYGPGQFDGLLTRAGGAAMNATTWLDRTNYFESVPKDQLSLVLELEADRMTGLQVDQQLFDAEKGAVLGELHMGEDDPDSVGGDKLFTLLFDKHPYHYSTIGTEAEIKGFSVADAQYFYRRYYAPNNAFIVIVGDVNPEAAISLVQDHFGSIPAQEIETIPSPQDMEPQKERFGAFGHTQLATEKVWIGYPLPAGSHPDRAALEVARAMLTQGEGGALRSAWVSKGLVSEVSGELAAFKEASALILSANLQKGRQVSELLSSLDRIVTEWDAAAIGRDVERARNQLLKRVYASWESNEGLAEFLGDSTITGEHPKTGFELVDAIRSVQPADVIRVARRYLIPSRRSVLVGKPKTAGESR